MTAKFPPVPSLKSIATRLEEIFPEGVSHRNYCVRDVAARTVWVMFYAGAIDGSDRWIRPSMVTDMTDQQTRRLSDAERADWHAKAASSAKSRPAKAWFAPNSREQIRDETLRAGLIPNGAVAQRKSIPTTSPVPKYALTAHFASLFDEEVVGAELSKEIAAWRDAYLSKSALARIALVKKGATKGTARVLVTYPNGHTRSLAAGPSSILSKAVVEEFSKRYLKEPAVLSEPVNKFGTLTGVHLL